MQKPLGQYISAVEQEAVPANGNADGSDEEVSSNDTQKLSTSKIAAKHSMKTAEWLAKAVEAKLLTVEGDRHYLTPAAKQAGIEFVTKSRFGPYFLWPEHFNF